MVDQVDNNEPNEMFNKLNVSIANSLNELVEQKGGQSQDLELRRKLEDPRFISIQKYSAKQAMDPDALTMFKALQKSDLVVQYPLITFDYDTYGKRCTSPYGFMPEYVRTPDGRLYAFDNWIFFSHDGKAYKYESISDLDGYTEDDVGEVHPINFEPEPTKSRFMPLDANDYELIESKLHQIKTGEYKPVSELDAS